MASFIPLPVADGNGNNKLSASDGSSNDAKQGQGGVNGASSFKTGIQNSVNEVEMLAILDQLHILRSETETVFAKRHCAVQPALIVNQQDAVLPLTTNVNEQTFKRTIPTYRAVLARRNILVKEKIGAGSYSKVRCGFCVLPNFNDTTQNGHIMKVAIKIVDRRQAARDYQERFMPREIEMWHTVRHPNIIRLHETLIDPFQRYVFMISEFAEGGDCLCYIQRVGALQEKLACSWSMQICCAVRYMHSRGICHRDLKLENLFLDAAASTVKIGDFGFSRHFSNSTKELSETYCGSKSYAAPEILRGVPHDAKKSDVWAIGVIGYILLTGKMPFNENQSNRQIVEDQKRLNCLAWDNFPGISSLAKSFILSTLVYAFPKRPAASAVLRHDWLLPHRDVINQMDVSYVGRARRPKATKKRSSVLPYQPGFSSNKDMRTGFASAALPKQPILPNAVDYNDPTSHLNVSDPLVVCSPPRLLRFNSAFAHGQFPQQSVHPYVMANGNIPPVNIPRYQQPHSPPFLAYPYNFLATSIPHGSQQFYQHNETGKPAVAGGPLPHVLGPSTYQPNNSMNFYS